MMMTFESYPFLEIALKYGADYGDVLLCAETFKNKSSDVQQFYASMRLPTMCYWDVATMMRLPVHERRGTPRISFNRA